jgi:thioredoxin-like negative regulator of GroEL
LYTKLNLVAGKEEDLSNLRDSIVVMKVDIDVFKDLAELYEVKSIPHVVFFKNGELQTDIVIGCQTEKIIKKISSLE